jgi:hypothetical protein
MKTETSSKGSANFYQVTYSYTSGDGNHLKRFVCSQYGGKAMKKVGPSGGKEYDVDGPGYNPVNGSDKAQNF